MSEDDDFEPRLGRIGARTPRRPGGFRGRVLAAAMLASGGRFGRTAPSVRAARFTGARIGKGAGVASVVVVSDRGADFRGRRVIVKFSAPTLAGKGMAAARAHLRYVQRDGVTPDGQPGRLYGAETDRADGRAFLDRAEEGKDRRQFRFIVSAEDGEAYDDLKPLTRRLMRQVEQDLGTRLDWVAVDHHDTGHPHTHILVRGRDGHGQELIIAKDYLTRGLRERAVELVSLDLGPVSDREIEGRLRREVDQERLTGLDRGLLRDVADDGLVSPRHGEPLQYALRAHRLKVLERMGLAHEGEPTRWRLAEGLEDTLRRMGERGDIQKTLYRALGEAGVSRALGEQAVFEPATSAPLVGRLVRRGLADEARDRHYLVVDGIDGRAHYVDIGRGEATQSIPEGAVVRVEARSAMARPADHTVADIAAAHGGRYSPTLHALADPAARPAFIESHVRRLEALRRGRTGVERDEDGTWRVAADHVERAAQYEARRALAEPVIVQALSVEPIEKLIGAQSVTWLDRQLLSEAPEPLRDAGFGQAARNALVQRRQWLLDQGLAQQQDGQVIYPAGLLKTLQRRERAMAAETIAREIGRPFAEARFGQQVDGVYRRTITLEGGRMAVIERSRDFTLVPWRPMLEGREGQTVSAVVRGDAINWSIGRGRSGPSIS